MTTFIDSESKTAGRWTKEEHQKFLYGLKLYGKNWKKIEDLIETRTSTQIRSHAQKFFIKMKKQEHDES